MLHETIIAIYCTFTPLCQRKILTITEKTIPALEGEGVLRIAEEWRFSSLAKEKPAGISPEYSRPSDIASGIFWIAVGNVV
jgi:hypothetical protein